MTYHQPVTACKFFWRTQPQVQGQQTTCAWWTWEINLGLKDGVGLQHIELDHPKSRKMISKPEVWEYFWKSRMDVLLRNNKTIYIYHRCIIYLIQKIYAYTHTYIYNIYIYIAWCFLCFNHRRPWSIPLFFSIKTLWNSPWHGGDCVYSAAVEPQGRKRGDWRCFGVDTSNQFNRKRYLFLQKQRDPSLKITMYICPSTKTNIKF